MPNKMLIDATHPEETRVVVLRGNRVEEFDFESANRKQLRGNIYLAKVTRVEPSLQAAFVDYGGNRHGFLAFGEIHPDYYQIPVADRQALIDEEERAARAAELEADHRAGRRAHRERGARRSRDEIKSEPVETHEETAVMAAGSEVMAPPAGDAGEPAAMPGDAGTIDSGGESAAQPDAGWTHETPEAETRAEAHAAPASELPGGSEMAPAGGYDAPIDLGQLEASAAVESLPGNDDEPRPHAGEHDQAFAAPSESGAGGDNITEVSAAGSDEETVESVGGADAMEEVPERMSRMRRQYKIQEVIKRRQVMLVQVVKEERGTKGAALTTYLSLAGRYSVLMPNTARGGGISRKITSGEDRARLKEIAQELEVPEGMGVILRTAGASRTKTEVKRDFEYLLRLWETVRDLTLKSTAPKLVYEEGSLVKRSIRDLYSKDIDEVVVAGPDAYHEAKDFMRMLMPSHAKNVKPYAETQPLLSRYGVENQLDAMFSPVVQLRSGGYIVLNQAEALVAIDVNSGRATREHHIEDTALKTNLEASDEISRQLRLRDLAGLIVIDYIDMDEKRNNRSVERRLKECLKQDRARIQVGRISHFGLLEMSRQRIRTSVLESSTEKCPYCGGSGHVRSVSSLALQVLRALEEQLIKGATHNLIARTRPDVALYVLNQKRAHLRGLEERFSITITIMSDDTVAAPQAFVIDRGEQVHTIEAAKAIAAQTPAIAVPREQEDDLEEAGPIESENAEAAPADATPEHSESEAGGRRRRRRGRGRGRDGGDRPSHAQPPTHEDAALSVSESTMESDGEPLADEDVDEQSGSDQGESAQRGDSDERAGAHRDGEKRRRRRGRRGGRRNRERNGETAQPDGGPNTPEHAFAPADELDTAPPLEPELKAAVADLEAATPAARPEPVHEQVMAPAAPPANQEPRRRSTVRERAPIASSEDATPSPPMPPPSAAPEPVVTAINETEDADRPRKTGWWSRRFAGG